MAPKEQGGPKLSGKKNSAGRNSGHILVIYEQGVGDINRLPVFVC